MVFFLLECDSLRFPQEPNAMGTSSKRATSCNYALRLSMLAKISEWYINHWNFTGVCYCFIFRLCFSVFTDSIEDAEQKVQSLERLVRSKIPLHSVFSVVCDRVWSKVVSRCRMITRSNLWPSLRREFVSTLESIEPDINLDLMTVLSDSTYRKYFDRYIVSNPSGPFFVQSSLSIHSSDFSTDMSCLHCWLFVHRLLQSVTIYHQQINSEPRSPIRAKRIHTSSDK